MSFPLCPVAPGLVVQRQTADHNVGIGDVDFGDFCDDGTEFDVGRQPAADRIVCLEMRIYQSDGARPQHIQHTVPQHAVSATDFDGMPAGPTGQRVDDSHAVVFVDAGHEREPAPRVVEAVGAKGRVPCLVAGTVHPDPQFIHRSQLAAAGKRQQLV